MRTNTSLTIAHVIYMVVVYFWLAVVFLSPEPLTHIDYFLASILLMLLLRNWELIREQQRIRQSQAALEEALLQYVKGVRL